MPATYEITEEKLNQIKNIILNKVHPVKIIAFGSRIKNNFRPDSDIDLLIIEREPFGEKRSRRKETDQILNALAHFRLPIDILLFTVDEVEEWKDSLNHIVAIALKEGKVLYEAA